MITSRIGYMSDSGVLLVYKWFIHFTFFPVILSPPPNPPYCTKGFNKTLPEDDVTMSDVMIAWMMAAKHFGNANIFAKIKGGISELGFGRVWEL